MGIVEYAIGAPADGVQMRPSELHSAWSLDRSSEPSELRHIVETAQATAGPIIMIVHWGAA
jgi:hypothetical protein